MTSHSCFETAAEDSITHPAVKRKRKKVVTDEGCHINWRRTLAAGGFWIHHIIIIVVVVVVVELGSFKVSKLCVAVAYHHTNYRLRCLYGMIVHRAYHMNDSIGYGGMVGMVPYHTLRCDSSLRRNEESLTCGLQHFWVGSSLSWSLLIIITHHAML